MRADDQDACHTHLIFFFPSSRLLSIAGVSPIGKGGAFFRGRMFSTWLIDGVNGLGIPANSEETSPLRSGEVTADDGAGGMEDASGATAFEVACERPSLPNTGSASSSSSSRVSNLSSASSVRLILSGERENGFVGEC